MGVCLNQFSGTCTNPSPSGYPGNTVPLVRIGQDYISSHDGTTTTLLLAESVLQSTPITNGTTTTTMPWFNRTAPGGTTNQPLWFNANWFTSSTTFLGTSASYGGGSGMELDVGFDWGTFSPTPTIKDKIYSNHSGGGCNVSFCDGHQQFMSPDIDVITYIHLMTPWDKGVQPNIGSGVYKIYCNVPNSLTPNNQGIPLQDVLDEAKIGS